MSNYPDWPFDRLFTVDRNLLRQLISEGLRVGASPWCADGYHEDLAHQICEARSGIYPFPQETFEETRDRRQEEDRHGM